MYTMIPSSHGNRYLLSTWDRLPACLDRQDACPTFYRTSYTLGMSYEFRLGQSMSAYRAGEISLSRAAELSGLPVREFLLRMAEFGAELNYDVAEFEADLAGSKA
jgi:predicted HTH domain antitoxin